MAFLSAGLGFATKAYFAQQQAQHEEAEAERRAIEAQQQAQRDQEKAQTDLLALFVNLLASPDDQTRSRALNLLTSVDKTLGAELAAAVAYDPHQPAQVRLSAADAVVSLPAPLVPPHPSASSSAAPPASGHAPVPISPALQRAMTTLQASPEAQAEFRAAIARERALNAASGTVSKR